MSRSPSSMQRLVYLRRFASFWRHFVWGGGNYIRAAAASDPFFLILFKSGPTDDETFFLPCSGSLWNRFLIFKAETNVRSFGFRGVCGSAYHIYPDLSTRKGTAASKKCHQHFIFYATPADEVKPLQQDVRPWQSWLTDRRQRMCKHEGLFRLFLEPDDEGPLV